MSGVIDFAKAAKRIRERRAHDGADSANATLSSFKKSNRKREPVRSAMAPPSYAHFVPVVTLAKGKFTLAIVTENDGRRLSLYNTANKIEIATRRVGRTTRAQWVHWAERVAYAWQHSQGHI